MVCVNKRINTTKNVNELWLISNALLTVTGSMGVYQCIALVRFGSGHGIFLYNVDEMNVLL